MSVAIVTGSAGLIGSESVLQAAAAGWDVVGIDNDMRAYFFGAGSTTAGTTRALVQSVKGYRHASIDIRDTDAVNDLFRTFGRAVSLVIHTAAQPSHDWAAREPDTDFGVNAVGTLNLLEATRKHSPLACFVFTSTNKVYGDRPNLLELQEQATRWELSESHPYFGGIDESMSIDQSTHSLFGVSKVAADLLVQEYGRYFGLATGIFRGGCLTGPRHAGAELHGFLSHLVLSAVGRRHYTVFGHKAKQVRDNIHSADLVSAFLAFAAAPRAGEVYNIGGGRHSNCSMMEAIGIVESLTNLPLSWSYRDDPRIGDHVWWISNTKKFESHYPAWSQRRTLSDTIAEMVQVAQARVAP